MTESESAVQCVAVRCNVLQCTAVCDRQIDHKLFVRPQSGLMQCDAVRCSALQCVAVRCSALQCVAVWGSALQCVAVRDSVMQCVAVLRVCDRERERPQDVFEGQQSNHIAGVQDEVGCPLLLVAARDVARACT